MLPGGGWVCGEGADEAGENKLKKKKKNTKSLVLPFGLYKITNFMTEESLLIN